MVALRRVASLLVVLALTPALGGCGEDAASASAGDGLASSAASPRPSARTTATDLSAIACATDDPEDLGELTGAWRGDEGGVYYIRQVGDCVWWFGTEIRVIEPGVTGQHGFANVASGRVFGTVIEVEWADLPMGDVLGGGGLTLVYVEATDQLRITQQRGDWQPFGATTLTRIEPNPSPVPSAAGSASP